MIFSLEFVAAFLCFAAVFNQLCARAQNLAWLGFNLAFIYWLNPYFLGVLLVYSALIHYLALLIFARRKRWVFLASCASAVAFLATFKYFAFFKAHANDLLLALGFSQDYELIFALGLSFYCFASLTYLRFVYSNSSAPAPFWQLLCYLSFFATFIAGPILPYRKFASAFSRTKRFYHARLIIALILIALAKKLAIAPMIFNLLDAPLNASAPSFLSLANSAFFYSFYLYLDFSAYSDLAISLALILGIKLNRNFAAPLAARNIADFWRRWHISLSSFIRDFIYIPLGGSRCGTARFIFATFAAFVLSGIWHGAGAGFAIWGALHAFGLIFYKFFAWLCARFFGDFRVFRFFAALLCFIYISFCWAPFHLELSELLNILSLEHDDASKSDALYCALAFLIFTLFYIFRGWQYRFARLFSNTFVAFLLTFALLYATFALMPAGVPNFIYAGF